MGALDDVLRPVAKDLISEFGKDLTFIVKDTETYNPVTGVTTVGESSVVVKGSPPFPYERRYIDGDVVKEGDMETLIAAQDLTITPDEGQRVEFDGEKWHVVSIRRIYSGSLVAAFRLQLRR